MSGEAGGKLWWLLKELFPAALDNVMDKGQDSIREEKLHSIICKIYHYMLFQRRMFTR